jgi:two-component system sensor histidine kinase HupT/HoxJ
VLFRSLDEIELEQKNTELEQSQQFIFSVLSAMSDVLLVCDEHGVIEETNAALRELVGRSDATLRGMLFHDLLADETSGESVRQVLANATPSRQGEAVELNLLDAQGQSVPVDANCTPRIAPNGRRVGTVFVGRPTAEIKRAFHELRAAHEALKRAQQQLLHSEKMASLGRLVAGVAHELNTPLGNALTVVSALEDRWAELDEMLGSGAPMRRSVLVDLVKDTRRGQDILQRNVAKAVDLVRDFKQVAIDQTSDTRRDFELARVIEDVLTMVEPSFKHTPYRVETELEDGLAMNSYPGALGQVLTNLLMNSLVHGFDGRDHGRVQVRCRALDRKSVV